jgi:SOS response regulatory protein OraA/RecX
MKNFKEYFSKKKNQKVKHDIMGIANVIGPLLDGIVHEIFIDYRKELLSEPIIYIVHAVWGAKKEGELTPSQKEINARVIPVINKVFDSLQMENLRDDQEFALYFLIRGSIISKMTYMIEAFRNKLKERTLDEQALKDALLHFKPIGNA